MWRYMRRTLVFYVPINSLGYMISSALIREWHTVYREIIPNAHLQVPGRTVLALPGL